MSKIEMLRLLINQRLTAAAEEIFGVFGRTIAEYEEEISRSRLEIERQRALLELSKKPRVSLQFSCPALSDQQDWSPDLDLNGVKPPAIKEEVEEPEEPSGEQSQEQFFLFQNNSVRTEEHNDHAAHLLPNIPSQDMEDLEMDSQPGPSVPQSSSDQEEEAPLPEERSPGNGQLDGSEVELQLSDVLDSYICSVCGQAFTQRAQWAKHMQGHRKVDSKGDRSYTCDICGKKLTRFDGYQKHLRVHTGEKPYCCLQCGRRFSDNSNYKRHIRTHMGHKPLQS